MTDANHFWQRLPKPFFVLAPMEDVTDVAFRTLIARKGSPDVTFTEFTSADGLVLAPEQGQRMLRKKLEFTKAERPIVAQLFSASPDRMEKAAALVQELGFDGLDINMGCPVDEVVKSGCGSGMIKNPPLAREIIRAAKRGAPNLPVSVKTRIGFNTDELDTWLPELLAEEPAVVTIHARTRKEMSAVPAHWDAVARAVLIRDSLGSKTLIVGNGDVKDIAHARQKVLETGCDGVMLGRAIYGNPWLFKELRIQRSASLQNASVPLVVRSGTPRGSEASAPRIASESIALTELAIGPREKLETLAEHIQLFDELMTGFANFAVMKKHFKAYVNGWDNAKELRVRLMETNTPEEALRVIATGLRALGGI